MNDTRTLNVKTLAMPSLATYRPSSQRSRRRKRVVYDISSAEQVLDWVERKGGTDARLDIAGKAFVVHWRQR